MRLFICFSLLLFTHAISLTSETSPYLTDPDTARDCDGEVSWHINQDVAAVMSRKGVNFITGQTSQPSRSTSRGADQRTAAERRRTELIKILNDPVIWRTDLGTVLETLPSWVQSKEDDVILYPNAIAGSTSYDINAQGLRKASATANDLHSALKSKPSFKVRTRELGALLNKATVKASELVPSGQPSAEPGRLRVLLTSGNTIPLKILAENLSVDDMKSRFDFQPEVEVHAFKLPGSARPEVLTYYIYAGGDITFVESEMDSPGYITRAMIDARAALPTIFQKR